jgi:hypothetical protein
LIYITVGVVRTVALGLLDILPDRDPLSEELGAEDEETETRDLEYEDMRPHWAKDPKEPPEGSGRGE